MVSITKLNALPTLAVVDVAEVKELVGLVEVLTVWVALVTWPSGFVALTE